MSEQKTSFMEALDQWTQTSIIDPLANGMLDAHESTWAEMVQGVKKAIHTKVLESYRNGQAAGSVKPTAGYNKGRQFSKK